MNNSLYIENNDLQEEIKQILVAFVKFMDEDHIVDGEGYYLLCKKNIWNFGKNCVFYRNDQIIPPHQYKFNFELEFASQVINRNASYDRGRNKSITDSNKKNNSNLRGVSLDDFGTPKSSNNTVNQEMIQHMTTRASISPLENWDVRQGATTTEFDSFDSPFDNKQSKSRFVESTPATLWVNRQRSVDNACITPLDNRRPVQKPVDRQKSRISSFTNREYPESMQQNSKGLFGYQEILDNVGETLRNPILVGETYEQTSRTSSIRLSQESFTGSNWPSQSSFETTLSLDSGSQKVSGISKSPFQTLRQMSSVSNGTDDFSNYSFGDEGELSMRNTADNLLSSERNNNRETNDDLEDNNFFR
ncbi:hypothetical protein RhiirC2_253991 [Rhizophagus irregularis]|uniref:Uncharacterized protein n=1 Tax=Rhizophagus irregularis TaxID=588596 RepID=A0A2N1NMV2_9GLOM|nr:hypothetical protein RhiirC2_253991 [Rhizophagus irregularis]